MRSISARSSAVGGDAECCADLAHPLTAQRAEAFDEDSKRHGLDRIEIDSASATDRVIAGFQDDFARQASDRRGARCHERALQTWDGGVSRQHDNRTSPDLGRFAPPHLTSSRDVRHV
jgi:hypothetical protein